MIEGGSANNPPFPLLPRDPRRNRKVKTVTETATATVTQDLARNATANAMVTVTQTATATMMMMMTVVQTQTQTVTGATPVSTVASSQVQTLKNSAAASSTTASAAANAAPASQSGLVSSLALGNLAPQASMMVGGQLVQVVTQPGSTVFAIATVTSTMFVDPINIVGTNTMTGLGSMPTDAGLTGNAKSEAISGRQAGHRVGGFGAVVLAVAVAVIIL